VENAPRTVHTTQVLKRPSIAASSLPASSSNDAPAATVDANTDESSLVTADLGADAAGSGRRHELLGLKLSELQKLASSLGVPAEQVGPHERSRRVTRCIIEIRCADHSHARKGLGVHVGPRSARVLRCHDETARVMAADRSGDRLGRAEGCDGRPDCAARGHDA
jgi:hypothetical protein